MVRDTFRFQLWSWKRTKQLILRSVMKVVRPEDIYGHSTLPGLSPWESIEIWAWSSQRWNYCGGAGSRLLRDSTVLHEQAFYILCENLRCFRASHWSLLEFYKVYLFGFNALIKIRSAVCCLEINKFQGIFPNQVTFSEGNESNLDLTGITQLRGPRCIQGCHGTGKTGNLKVHFSRQGKHREFAKKY